LYHAHTSLLQWNDPTISTPRVEPLHPRGGDEKHMPIREDQLTTDYYYHVFNRGVEKRKTFIDTTDFNRFITTCIYYRFPTPPVKLSTYLEATKQMRVTHNENLKKITTRLVNIHCYCLMPNHFHFLLRQSEAGGISNFLMKITDSYTKYFNKRYNRVGPLFQGTFKSVLIENEEEFLHVSRYIQLNPYTANTSMTIKDCLTYPWSSARNYFTEQSSFIDTTPILSSFKTGKEGYKEFIAQQGAYQRSLAMLRSVHTDM